MQPVLDPAAGPVSGDPDRLQQIVWNLVANAIKHTPRGGRVQIRLARVNSHLEIRVEDSGDGIDPEVLPHIFDRFRAAPDSGRGLGLGLAIVRHLTELHGGMVQASSLGSGQGATFVVKLPLMILAGWGESQAGAHPTAETGRGQLEAPGLDGLRVLVVDDEQDAREMIAAVLTERGAEVVLASSAQEALRALDLRVPDVLLSDIEMPGEDGYALIRKVRQRSEDQGGSVPAAALTAYARTEDRMQALMAGFHIHVPKPVQPAELAAVVSSLARRPTRSSGPHR